MNSTVRRKTGPSTWSAFAANGITDADKKRSIFLTLTVIGPATFRLLRSLLHPTKLEAKTYKELCTALATHFKPTPCLNSTLAAEAGRVSGYLHLRTPGIGRIL